MACGILWCISPANFEASIAEEVVYPAPLRFDKPRSGARVVGNTLGGDESHI